MHERAARSGRFSGTWCEESRSVTTVFVTIVSEMIRFDGTYNNTHGRHRW